MTGMYAQRSTIVLVSRLTPFTEEQPAEWHERTRGVESRRGVVIYDVMPALPRPVSVAESEAGSANT